MFHTSNCTEGDATVTKNCINDFNWTPTCIIILLYLMELYFRGNSSHSEEIFKIQKGIIRIITNSSKNASCWHLFKDLNILPILSQYIFSILLFVSQNKNKFLSNSQVHKINTRQTSNLYVPTAKLTIYQMGFYYSGIKIYNHLPTAIKDVSGDKNKFKLALKRYLLHNSFYSLEEYFNT
jgi:hypothetical protein